MAPKKKAADEHLQVSGEHLQFSTRAHWMASNWKANAINAGILNDVLLPSLVYIQNLAVFSDWESPAPLQLKQQDSKEQGQLGAFMAPFDKKACQQSLENSGKYICAMPLPHFNMRYSPTPGVRLNKGEIDQAIADDDYTYKVWPMQRIAVCSDEDKFTDLTVISPEEPRIAHICNFAMRHERGDVSAEEELDFKRVIWCIPCLFYICDSAEKRFFDALAERRDAVKMCRMVRRSGSQIVDEIMSVALRLGGVKCTAQKILDMYKKNITNEGGGDETLVVSLGMINDAMLLQKTIKDVPPLAQILQEADDKLLSSSPFFQITNLAAVVKRIKNPQDLRWTMEYMVDCVMQQPDLFWPIRLLAPKGGEVGILDQHVFKHHLKNELLSKVEEMELDPQEKTKFRDCLSSVVTMRQCLGYKTGPQQKQQPDKFAEFLTGISECGERLFKLIHEWVYTSTHDEAITGHLRQKRTAKDLVKLPPIADAIKEIQEQLQSLKESAEDKEDDDDDEEEEEEDIANPPKASPNPAAKKKAIPAKRPRNEDGQFLGMKDDGTELRSKNLSAEAIKIITAEMKDAAFIVNRDCTFIVVDNSMSEDELSDLLRKSKAIGQCPEKRTAVLYETGVSGQASCNPKCNSPPFRREHYEKCIRSHLNSRCPDSNSKASDISPKDTFYIWDNRKGRNHVVMTNTFSHNKTRMDMAEPKELLCVWDTSVIQDSKIKSKRGFAVKHSKESENIIVISRHVFGSDIDYKERKWHTGNNASGVIGFIQPLPPNSVEEFRATPEQKSQIFGVENTIPMSGSTYISSAEDPGHASQAGQPEPVFWWGSTEKFADEMIHSYSWERMVCCNAGNGAYAIAGCINRVPGVYICMTEAHKTFLIQHVTTRIFQLKQNRECSSLYSPALAAALGAKEEKDGDKPKQAKAESEPPSTPAKTKGSGADQGSGTKPKPKSMGRPRQPPKKKKKAANGEPIPESESEDSGMWTDDD